ncbi:MAG: hypothetical protein AAGA69_02605 [Pseudomonadota bacterium]
MEYERPNTISGLQAKRKELATLHNKLIAEAKKVLCDIDHIDACIRLFDPDADIERIRLNRYATKHRAPKGQMKRFILDQFREATEPLSSRDITEAWIKDRGLQPDESTFVILRKRVGAAINSIKQDGMIEQAGDDGTYKLWQLKRGDQ